MVHIENNKLTKESQESEIILINDSELPITEIMESLLDDVTSKRVNSIECSHCGKRYQRPYMLKKHIEAYHQNYGSMNTSSQKSISVTDDIINEENIIIGHKSAENCDRCSEAIKEQENINIRALREVEDLKAKLKEQNEAKEENEKEMLLKIKDIENKSKANEKSYKKNVKQLQDKIVILEEAMKNYVIELDKQVQLKEKYAEEKKTLTNIIKTHLTLKDLQVELKQILSIEDGEESNANEEVIATSDNEWEDIDSEETENDGFVKVLSRRKKMLLKQQQLAKKGKIRNKTVSCLTCVEKFTSKSELNKHSAKHVNKSSFDCGVCKRTFSSEKNLEDHATEHRAKSVHKCERCKSSYSSAQDLQVHKESKHNSVVPIKCRLCEFHTDKQVDFLLHMEIHNSEEKKFNKINSVQKVCSWFLQDKCRFGDKCWNIHTNTNPTPCIFKSKCRAWPQCKFSHYEVCEDYQECKKQNCKLEHPSKPFLGSARPQKTPNIFSHLEFPQIQRRPRFQKQ